MSNPGLSLPSWESKSHRKSIVRVVQVSDSMPTTVSIIPPASPQKNTVDLTCASQQRPSLHRHSHNLRPKDSMHRHPPPAISQSRKPLLRALRNIHHRSTLSKRARQARRRSPSLHSDSAQSQPKKRKEKRCCPTTDFCRRPSRTVYRNRGSGTWPRRREADALGATGQVAAEGIGRVWW